MIFFFSCLARFTNIAIEPGIGIKDSWSFSFNVWQSKTIASSIAITRLYSENTFSDSQMACTSYAILVYSLYTILKLEGWDIKGPLIITLMDFCFLLITCKAFFEGASTSFVKFNLGSVVAINLQSLPLLLFWFVTVFSIAELEDSDC